MATSATLGLMSVTNPPPASRLWVLVALIAAGESIFGLPFHVPRFFRTVFVSVFDISQFQLGTAQSVYGVVAMFGYLAGGSLADRFAPRTLLSVSLVLTAAGGVYLYTIPSITGLVALYAWWGMTTTLPFWAALIKATRVWGGAGGQGRAFGLLDGGRGLLAAVLASGAVAVLTGLVNPDAAAGSEIAAGQRLEALQQIIVIYIAATLAAAGVVWVALRPRNLPAAAGAIDAGVSPDRRLRAVLSMPTVWLQAIVIIAAYSGFKGIDYYAQYAKDRWGWGDADAATLATAASWMRPVAAVTAGLLADRLRASSIVVVCFAAGAIASGGVAVLVPGVSPLWLLWTLILVGAFAYFGLRGVYFALMGEAKVPVAVTGTAVGVVSFIGFLPEVFLPIVGGALLDTFEGTGTGFAWLFAGLAGLAVVGAIAAVGIKVATSPAPRRRP